MKTWYLLSFLVAFSAGCTCLCDGDPRAHATTRIRQDGGDTTKALCQYDSSDGAYECNYKMPDGIIAEIECTRCGCRYDD